MFWNSRNGCHYRLKFKALFVRNQSHPIFYDWHAIRYNNKESVGKRYYIIDEY